MSGIRLCDFTKGEIDYLIANCNFTPDELAVFLLRTKNHSVAKVSMELHMSEATVQRRIKAIKKKIVRSV